MGNMVRLKYGNDTLISNRLIAEAELSLSQWMAASKRTAAANEATTNSPFNVKDFARSYLNGESTVMVRIDEQPKNKNTKVNTAAVVAAAKMALAADEAAKSKAEGEKDGGGDGNQRRNMQPRSTDSDLFSAPGKADMRRSKSISAPGNNSNGGGGRGDGLPSVNNVAGRFAAQATSMRASNSGVGKLPKLGLRSA